MIYKDQWFSVCAETPYLRKDGQLSVLATWRAACATCGEEFQFLGSRELRAPIRRCEKHRGRSRRIRKLHPKAQAVVDVFA